MALVNRTNKEEITGLATTKPTTSPPGDGKSTMGSSPAGEENGARPYTEPYPES